MWRRMVARNEEEMGACVSVRGIFGTFSAVWWVTRKTGQKTAARIIRMMMSRRIGLPFMTNDQAGYSRQPKTGLWNWAEKGVECKGEKNDSCYSGGKQEAIPLKHQTPSNSHGMQ